MGHYPLQGRAKQTYTSLTVHLLRRFTHTYTQAHTHTHTYLYMVIYRYLELHSMSFLVLRGKHEARWKWRSRTKNTTREVYRKLAPKCVFGKWLVQPRLRLSRRKTPGWSSRCIHIYIITYHIIHVYIYICTNGRVYACACGHICLTCIVKQGRDSGPNTQSRDINIRA